MREPLHDELLPEVSASSIIDKVWLTILLDLMPAKKRALALRRAEEDFEAMDAAARVTKFRPTAFDNLLAEEQIKAVNWNRLFMRGYTRRQ